jgi:hypothetical protein
VGKSAAGESNAKKQQADVPTTTAMEVSPHKSVMSEPSVQKDLQRGVGKSVQGEVRQRNNKLLFLQQQL